MALNLNDQSVRLPYQEFYGQNREQMPLLIADGRTPLSVAGLMERRLTSAQTAEWRDNYFDTGDAIVYHPDGKFKIVNDAQFLREISPTSNLESGALLLENGMYESLDGAEFSRKDKGLIVDKDMSPAQIKAHPMWKHLAREDGLLNAYVDAMVPEMKKRFGYDETMGVYVASTPKVPNARALYVIWLELRSQLYGRNDLDLGNGRLVGVAQDALSASGNVVVAPTLEQALAVVGSNWDTLKLRRTR